MFNNISVILRISINSVIRVSFDINKLNSEKIENINSEIEKINKGIENIGNELALIDTKSIEFKAKYNS